MKRILSIVVLLILTLAAYAQKATVQKVWIDHDQTRNGEKGILIHVKFSVDNAQGHDITLQARVQSPKNTYLRATNPNYKDSDGDVFVSKTDNATYKNSVWNDMKLWLPLSAFSLKVGKHNYCVRIDVYDKTIRKHITVTPGYCNFVGTGSSENNTPRYSLAPDYQNNGWKEWYFSNGNVACKVSQHPGEDGIMAYHITPEPTGTLMAATFTGWKCVGTEGDYNLYEPWKYEFKTDVRYGRMWYEWKRKMDELVLKIAKDWSRIVYPKAGLPWYNQVHLNRVSQQQYKATVRAQEENLARAKAKYGNGNYGNGGSTSSNGGSSVYSKCRICHGSGQCTTCRGTGTGMYTYGGTSHTTCSSCNGSGRCFNCYGTGRQ